MASAPKEKVEVFFQNHQKMTNLEVMSNFIKQANLDAKQWPSDWKKQLEINPAIFENGSG